jgi:hypothetical protein
MTKLFYIISYKHSSGGKMTFWGPNNCGYTTNLKQAGIYTEKEVRSNLKYYNNETYGIVENKAIPVEDIEKHYRTSLIVEPNYIQRKKHLKLIKRGILLVQDLKRRINAH